MVILSPEVADKALSLLLSNLADSHCAIEGNNAEEELQAALTAFQNHVRTRIAKLRREQNLSAPIYRLPSEVLATIFLQVLASRIPNNLYRVSMTLAAVSSRWYATATAIPRLWNCLTSTLDLKLTKLMLERCKKAPIHVSVMGQNDKLGRDFINLIIPHTSRWKTLEFDSRHSSTLALEFFSGKYMPILEQLTTASLRPDHDIPQAFDTSLDILAPSLKSLYASSISFPLHLEPGLYSQLTDIRFAARKGDASFLVKDYHDLLLSAPYLKEIYIQGFGPTEPTLEVASSFNVFLPNLQRLSLMDLPCNMVGMLVSSISAPRVHFPFVYLSDSRPHNALSRVFHSSPAPSTLLATISTSDWLSVSVTDFEEDGLCLNAGIQLPGRRRGLFGSTLVYEMGARGEAISTFLAMGCFPELKTMEIKGLELIDAEALASALLSMPHLETLRIRAWESEGDADHDSFRQFIGYMTWPFTSTHGTSWICPRLRNFAFDSLEVDWSALTKLIRGRTRAVDTIDTSSILPCRLELIELSYYHALKSNPHSKQLEQVAAERGVDISYKDMHW